MRINIFSKHRMYWWVAGNNNLNLVRAEPSELLECRSAGRNSNNPRACGLLGVSIQALAPQTLHSCLSKLSHPTTRTALSISALCSLCLSFIYCSSILRTSGIRPEQSSLFVGGSGERVRGLCSFFFTPIVLNDKEIMKPGSDFFSIYFVAVNVHIIFRILIFPDVSTSTDCPWASARLKSNYRDIFVCRVIKQVHIVLRIRKERCRICLLCDEKTLRCQSTFPCNWSPPQKGIHCIFAEIKAN